MAGTAVVNGAARRPIGAQQEIGILPAASIPTIQYSTGAAKVLQQFSRDMFALGNQLHDRLDVQAEEEASQAGAMDALAGTFKPTGDFTTIRARAYNKAGLETFITTMETNSILKVEALKQQYANDPAGLQRALRDYQAGVMGELAQVDPRLSAGFEQRFTLRSMPAIEQARDAHFTMTRSQADAAILQGEVALKAELRTVAADLFSDNPDRSGAAAAAVGMVQADMMRVYDAVDPVSGQPLYSALEREKARQGFYETVMESAALSWFDQQENKADAYLRFTGEDFTINLNTPGTLPGGGGVVADTLRGKGWSPVALAGILGHLQAESGFNPTITGDGGKAFGIAQWHADRQAGLFRYAAENGLDPKSLEAQAGFIDWELRFGDPQSRRAGQMLAAATTVEEAVDAFMFFERPLGFSADNPKGGHNYSGRFSNANAAYDALSTPNTQTVDVRAALPTAVMDRIETEMRQRISFTNQITDRQAQQEAAALEAQQAANDFEMTIAALAPAGTIDPETGQAFVKPTLASVADAQRNGLLSPTAAKALTRALTVEAPQTSESELYADMLRRMHSGEDIRDYVYENMARLSAEDARALLTQNNSLNVAGAGSLSADQQFYEARLKDTLEPDGLMAELDDGAEERKFLALDEYRQRVLAGESAREVAIELQERAKVDEANAFGSALGALIRPRYSVPSTTPGQIDIAQSAAALQAALAENKISDDQYWQQAELLRRWNDIQQRMERGEL